MTITTTTRGGTLLGTHSPPTTTTNPQGTTPCNSCHPAVAGQHHAPLTVGELSKGCKTSSVQWKDREGKHVHQRGLSVY